MNTQKGWFWMVVLFSLVLTGALLLASCAPRLRVGELQSESQTVALDDADAVSVEIELGAGELQVTGGAQELLEADFTYNVARLEPEVQYTGGKLTIRQPDAEGLPALPGITDFRNEWDLRFNDDVPMDLRVDMGAGTSNLQLADLSLTGLDINLGASESTIDLSGDWAQDLGVSIEAGAASLTVRLPSDIGVRVEIEAGPTAINASGLTKDGNVYTNAAYGTSEVTLQITIEAGVGQVNLLESD